MLLVTIFALGAAATGLRRQAGGVGAITSGIATINTDTMNLESMIQSVMSLADAANVVAAVDTLVSDINNTDGTVQATDPLSCTDSLSLADPVTTLAQNVISAIVTTENKAATFSNLTLNPTVVMELQMISNAATPLANDLVGIIDPSLMQAAQSLADQILGALQNGITFYQGNPSAPPASTLSFTPISTPSCTSGGTSPTTSPTGSTSGTTSGSTSSTTSGSSSSTTSGSSSSTTSGSSSSSSSGSSSSSSSGSSSSSSSGTTPPGYSSGTTPPGYSSGTTPPGYSSGTTPPPTYPTSTPPGYTSTGTGPALYTGAAHPAYQMGGGVAVAAGFAALVI